MNKKLIVLLTVLLTAITVQAQDHKHREERKEQVKAAKIAFFTEEMGLSVEEAQVFWPLYNTMWDELQEIHRNTRKAFRAIEALEELGDYTAEEMNRDIYQQMKTAGYPVYSVELYETPTNSCKYME